MNIAENKPIYQHDCDCCTFLGNAQDEYGEYDLYHHFNGDNSTIIARYSSEGSNYISGMNFGATEHERGEDTPMSKAFRLAKEKGLNTKNRFPFGYAKD